MTQRITQSQLYEIIRERGFDVINKTIKKQVSEGVQIHNLNYLEIGQIIWYAYEVKGLKPNAMYGLGPVYNVKDEALAYFRSLDTKIKKQEEAIEKHLEDNGKDKNIIAVSPQERKFKPRMIDLEDL